MAFLLSLQWATGLNLAVLCPFRSAVVGGRLTTMSSCPAATFPPPPSPLVAPPSLEEDHSLPLANPPPPRPGVLATDAGAGNGCARKPFQSSLSLSHRTIEPSACDVTKRLERGEVRPLSPAGEVGEVGGAGGSQRIEVTGDEVMHPDLLYRE